MRRLRTALVVAIAVAVASCAAALAQGFGLVPGQTMRSQDSADAGFGDANNNFVQVSAFTGQNSFRLRGGGAVTVNGTEVDVTAFTSNGLFAFGCWIVPDSDFSVSQGLDAKITFDSTAAGVAECPGAPAGPAISAAPAPIGLQDSVTGFVGPVIVSTTLTATGSPLDQTVTANTTCQSFSALDHQTMVQQGDAATVTVTAMTVEGTDPNTGETVDVDLSGYSPTSGFGAVFTFGDNLVVNGPSTGTCGPFGNQ